MDADERLTALKKAYADIILNTSKEAAARIMVSERKAVGFQHELSVTKEQALQTMLRLKQMMDSKGGEAGMTCVNQQKIIEELKAQLREAEHTISKAEMTSLSQQRKIEELEAQLEEAEDIVKEVREELREVQAELERVRNSQLQPMDINATPTREQTSQEKILTTSQSITFPTPQSRLEPFSSPDQRNNVYECYSVNDTFMANSRMSKPDLPSASEEKKVNTNSVLFSQPEKRLESFTASDMKNSASYRRNEVFKCNGIGFGMGNSSASNQRNEVFKCNGNGFGMGNSFVSKPDVPSVTLKSKEPTPYINRRTQRIRAFEEKLMAGELAFSESIEDVNYETSGREDGVDEGIRKTSANKADNMRSAKKKEVVRVGKGSNNVQKVRSFRQKRRRTTGYKKNKTPSSKLLSDLAVKSDQTPDVSCVNIDALSCGNTSNMVSADKADMSPKITESGAEFDNAGSVEHTTKNDEAPIDELSLMRQEGGSADGSGAVMCEIDVKKVDVPVVNSQTKASDLTNGIPNQPVTVGSRVIKYTFQRKRKRESLSSIDCSASVKKSILEKKEEEKQYVAPVMEMSSSIVDSPRDSRRLAQVAHQLVSLSEKKWRQ